MPSTKIDIDGTINKNITANIPVYVNTIEERDMIYTFNIIFEIRECHNEYVAGGLEIPGPITKFKGQDGLEDLRKGDYNKYGLE